MAVTKFNRTSVQQSSEAPSSKLPVQRHYIVGRMTIQKSRAFDSQDWLKKGQGSRLWVSREGPSRPSLGHGSLKSREPEPTVEL